MSKTTLLIGSEHGIFRSASSGRRWTRVVRGATTRITIDPASRNVIAAGASGIRRSVDSGLTWQSANAGLHVSEVSAVAAPSNRYIYAAGTFTVGNFRVSEDGGATWSVRGYRDRIAGPWVVADPAAERTVLVGDGRRIMKSTDAGRTWRNVAPAISEQLVRDPVSNVLYAVGRRNGLWRSDDMGASWTRLGVMPGAAVVASGGRLASWGIDSGVYDSGSSLTWISDDGGDSWRISRVSLDYPESVVIAESNRDVMYATMSDVENPRSRLHRSVNGGRTWTALPAPPRDPYVTTIARDDPNRLYSLGWPHGLMTSADGGQTWVTRTTQPLQPATLVASPADPNALWVGTWNNGLWRIQLDTGGAQ